MLSHINVGTGLDVTIRDMAETIKRVVGHKEELQFDASKLEEPPRKLIDKSKLMNMGWTCGVDLEDGLWRTYAWYLETVESS
ncbi:hypothetical protein N8622_00410 [bacterium]|nr:hypothetical protein [bacterium]